MYRCALLGFPMESLDREVRGRLFETLIPWVTRTCGDKALAISDQVKQGHCCPITLGRGADGFSMGLDSPAQTGSARLIQPGVEAPDFTLDSLDGEAVTLSSFRGKNTVVLIEWATWCDYCKVEIPETSAMVDELAARGVVVLALNFMEESAVVKEFAATHSLRMPILLDRERKVARAYRMTSIPVLAIVDTEGTLRHIGKGVGPDELRKLLAPIIVNPGLIDALLHMGGETKLEPGSETMPQTGGKTMPQTGGEATPGKVSRK